MDNIIIFGAGEDANDLLDEMRKNKDHYQANVLAVCDSDERKWRTAFCGVEVLPPDTIARMPFDYIVIASEKYLNEIHEKLTAQLRIPPERIRSLERYKRTMNIQYQYAKNLANEKAFRQKKYNTEKIVVYTAIHGDYDLLRDPLFADDGVTYVCFTEDRSVKSNAWNMEYVTPSTRDSVMASKEYKLLPHKFFPDFETSVWIDANFRIEKDLRKFIGKYGRGSDFLCFPHNARKCVYEEGAEVIRMKKAPKGVTIRQLHAYLEKGHPENGGLLWGGCLVRNHNDPTLKKIMEEWWKHVNQFSKRDQISLPYVLRSNDYHCDLCDLDGYDNEWFSFSRHKFKPFDSGLEL